MTHQAQKILRSEPQAATRLRRWIVVSMVALYFLIGVPMWLKLTEIYRADLPEAFIDTLYRNENVDTEIRNQVCLRVPDGFKFPDLAEAVQIQVDSELHKMQQDPNERLIVDWNVTLVEEHCDVEFVIKAGDSEGIVIDEIEQTATLFFTLESIKNNDLPFFIAQSLLYHLFDSEIQLLKARNQQHSTSAISYSPKVHLSFKLLNGDGYPVDWAIHDAISHYLTPLLHNMRHFINFTIDSEIVFYTGLNIDPKNTINVNDLSSILDFGEWDINSNDLSYPTLNFILYYPSETQSPLRFVSQGQVLDSEDEFSTFLIPQWGSIIMNTNHLPKSAILTKEYLKPVLEKFTSELFTLLNLPKNPKNPSIRISALLKYSIIANLNKAVESLNSLLKLSKSLPNISIPQTVLDNVKLALHARENVVRFLRELNFDQALIESSKMLQYSEDAFFDKKMVQQNFFPQEHKIAVYMPLLGPLSIVCFLGLLRVVKELKQ